MTDKRLHETILLFLFTLLFLHVASAPSPPVKDQWCAELPAWTKWADNYVQGAHHPHEKVWRNIIFDSNELRHHLEKLAKKSTNRMQPQNESGESIEATALCLKDVVDVLPEDLKFVLRWEQQFHPAQGLQTIGAIRNAVTATGLADEGVVESLKNLQSAFESIDFTHKRLKTAYNGLVDAVKVQKDDAKCRVELLHLTDAIADVSHTRRPLVDALIEDALESLNHMCSKSGGEL